MKDVRTPVTYFHKQGASPEAISMLKGKLDDLLESLYEYKQRFATTVAEEKILDKEIDKAERKVYKKNSKHNAVKVMDAIASGNAEDVADAIWEALDYKCYVRVEPYLHQEGKRIEGQVFGIEEYGNK
tara:strand:- start:696 stop:1079 length:384 start_codon:yes stop_codon:yes gene_type:complete